MMKSNQPGFSLIEILMVCAIIGVIILATTKYFIATQENYRVSQTLQDMRAIREGAAEWGIANADYTGISLATLRTAGLIPSTLNNGPWGTAYTIQSTSDNAGFSITLSNIPAQDCLNLAQKTRATFGDAASCNQGTFTLMFPQG